MGKSETGLMSDYRFTAAVEQFDRMAEDAERQLTALREQRANGITAGDATNFALEASIARKETSWQVYTDVARQLRSMSDLMVPKASDEPTSTRDPLDARAQQNDIATFRMYAREFRTWKNDYGWDQDVKNRAQSAIDVAERIVERLR